MANAVPLGALFLLALIAPIYVGDPRAVLAAQGTSSTASLLVVLGIAGAAGIGSLLALAGEGVWHFLFPYTPRAGIDRWLWRRRKNFRADRAPELQGYWEQTAMDDWGVGSRALLAEAFVFYRDAPSTVREWTRRRHDRFSVALSSIAAIGLGLAAGLIVDFRIELPRMLVSAMFVVVAILVGDYAFGQRQAADRMEHYWLRLRAAGLDPVPPAS